LAKFSPQLAVLGANNGQADLKVCALDFRAATCVAGQMKSVSPSLSSGPYNLTWGFADSPEFLGS
jgi:hypothetical protein